MLNFHLTVIALDHFVHDQDTFINVCIIGEICFTFSLLITLDPLLNVLEDTHKLFLFLLLFWLVEQGQYLRWFIFIFTIWLDTWWHFIIWNWMILFYLQAWLTSECLQGIAKWLLLWHFKSCNLILVSYGWLCCPFDFRSITHGRLFTTATAGLAHSR